jgi:prepilin-type N-terminal cleavage/methylation domain-containing protein
MTANVQSDRGFSLIEMMIAMVITVFSLLALSSAVINAIAVNLGNELRNTAARLTSQTAEVILTLPIENISPCGLTPDPDALNYNASYLYGDGNSCLGTGLDYRKYPNPAQSVKGSHQNFNITWAVTDLNSNLRQVTITVAYRHRGENLINSAVVYKHRTL